MFKRQQASTDSSTAPSLGGNSPADKPFDAGRVDFFQSLRRVDPETSPGRIDQEDGTSSLSISYRPATDSSPEHVSVFSSGWAAGKMKIAPSFAPGDGPQVIEATGSFSGGVDEHSSALQRLTAKVMQGHEMAAAEHKVRQGMGGIDAPASPEVSSELDTGAPDAGIGHAQLADQHELRSSMSDVGDMSNHSGGYGLGEEDQGMGVGTP